MKGKRPLPWLQPTTLWDFPSQNYGPGKQGDTSFAGATPSWIIWNLLARYTLPKDLVVDPMAGSGTTLDVARDLGRRALAYDLAPKRRDIFRADARHLPLENEKADFVFIDPPYGDHLVYSDDPRCIGRLAASDPAYTEAMDKVFAEAERILRRDRYLAVYIADSYSKRGGFIPVGFKIFNLLCRRFHPIDIIAVVRRNQTLHLGNYRAAAEEGNFYLRGFHYLFIFYRPPLPAPPGYVPALIPARLTELRFA
ncbi:MAG: DNA methyltransferase, partial [Planctomycetota bacterium]|nr:DNA methyltransferase [Planctomycetota bacterium]